MGKLKGFSIVGLIIVLVVVAIAAVVLLLGFGGFGFGGGKGDGEGDGDSTSAAASVDEPEETPVIENIDYINVTVSGNEYLFDNKKLSREELIDELTKISPNGIPVKITDDDAALDSYQQLIDALDEHKIKYIEDNMV